MAIRWPPKDPDAVLDYALDWLGTAAEPGFLFDTSDTIDTSTWTVVDGTVIVDSDSIVAGTKTVVWLSAGAAGETCHIRNRIVTMGGRHDDRTVIVKIKEK